MSGVTTGVVIAGIGAAAAVGGGVLAASQANKANKEMNRQKSIAADAANQVAVAPVVEEVKKSQESIKKQRINLFETEGGILGQELQPNQVSKRQTLLGN